MADRAILLLTALPPTIGHTHLIDFAAHFCALRHIHHIEVLVCSRDVEPLSGGERRAALRKRYMNRPDWMPQILIRGMNKDVPQEPGDHPDFWSVWRDLIRHHTSCSPGDLLFASEPYGVQLAEALECTFVPCDPERATVNAAATAIRSDPAKNFHLIMPEAQPLFRKTVTLFGAESTGKTTLATTLGARLNGYVTPEWARPYLELCGPEVDDDRMAMIEIGQAATEDAATHLINKPFIFRDTDLLSTIGYYRIYKGEEPEGLRRAFEARRADLYILMNSNIPFTPDKLRYGGDKRESTDRFWQELLEEFECSYMMMEDTTPTRQLAAAASHSNAIFGRHPLWGYQRRQAISA